MRVRTFLFSAGALAVLFSACSRSGTEDLLFDPELDGGSGSGGDSGTGAFGGSAGIAGGTHVGGSSGFGGSAGVGGSAGFGGSVGVGGSSGFGGSAGEAGSAGVGGSAGFGGSVGVGGSSGFGGSVGVGGSAGVGGSVGVGGSSGFGGSVGVGGSAGFGGSAGVGGAPPDANFFDSFPFPDSGPIANCVQCAEQSCAAPVNACFNNSACGQGIACAVTSCGGFNLQCIFGCFGGDISAALQAFQVFSCLAQNCGQQCIGVITGGGGSGGAVDAGSPPSPAGGASGGGVPGGAQAGGSFGQLSPELAWQLGLSHTLIYVPSPEVLDALPRGQR